MKKPTQLIVTRRGIVDIDDVTVNDEVYTAKRRWKKVISIESQISSKIVKSEYSFFTLIGNRQGVVSVDGNSVPYYIPRDKNLDLKNNDYWFKVGSSLSKMSSYLLYSDTFFIPINIILMDKIKCKSFLEGFFSNSLNIKNISKRAKLGLSFMLKKLTRGHDYRSTYLIKKRTFTLPNKKVIIKTLVIEEDNSYCVNGLYVYNM